MNKNSLIPKENAFIVKIRNFFSKLKSIFSKKNNESIIEEQKIEPKIEKEENKFSEQIKVNTDDYINKEIFLKSLEENPELLDKLSIERLEKLSNYYDVIIAKNNEIIKSLK